MLVVVVAKGDSVDREFCEAIVFRIIEEIGGAADEVVVVPVDRKGVLIVADTDDIAAMGIGPETRVPWNLRAEPSRGRKTRGVETHIVDVMHTCRRRPATSYI